MKLSTINWLNGVLGLWVVLIAFLGFSSTLNKILLVITGGVIAFYSFKMASSFKSDERVSETDIIPDASNIKDEIDSIPESSESEQPEENEESLK